MAKACGYVSTKKDGGERINFTSFYEALLNAKGVELGGGGTAGIGKGGRKLSYKAVVWATEICCRQPSSAMLDLQPGDEFTIKLSKKKGVTLVPVGSEDEEGEED